MFAAARWIMVLGLMVSIGLHTVVIQSAAWAGMLVSYSLEKGSVAQGVSETFDGAHPCPLCKLAKTTESAPADDKQAPEGKLKLHLIADAVPAIVISAPPPPVYPVRAEARLHVLNHTPDTPPPRRSLA
ncbi:MAG: hypothetical protein Q8M07_29635 [Prosthecobacter sp.]|nr:hypothetical protein [Prosthecobacter sp.]